MKSFYTSLGVACLLAFGVLPATAQVNFTAKANKTTVGQYDQFTVVFRVNDKGEDFKAPAFQNFQVLSGPNTSYSSTFINGKQSRTESYSYYLRPQKPGTFTIGSARIKVRGETHSTAPLRIKVVPGKTQSKDPNSPENVAARHSFFEATINRRELYVGEPLVATYKVYFDTRIEMPQVMEEPSFTGFYKDNIENTIKTKETTYRGKRFNSAAFKQMVLIPQKAGSITPGKIAVKIPTLVATNKRDFFGGRVNKKVANIVTREFPALKIKPLPQNNKPSPFSGAVGNFDLEVKVSREKVQANESLTLTVKVSGNGNLPLFKVEEPRLPGVFEVFEPEYKQNIKPSLAGFVGYKTYQYLLVPRYNGTYKIPPITFSFFDPEAEKYVVRQSDPVEITVDGGADAPQNPAAAGKTLPPGTDNSQEVEYLNRDILFIKTQSDAWRQEQSSFWNSRRFWIIWGTLMILSAALAVYYFAVYRRQENPAERRTRRAGKEARKHLREAQKAAQNNNREAFFKAISTALWGYLASKLQIPHSRISKEEVRMALQQKGISSEATQNLMELLESAELAQYATLDRSDLQHDYEKAAAILTEVEKQLPK